jgi:hypothetical protein
VPCVENMTLTIMSLIRCLASNTPAAPIWSLAVRVCVRVRVRVGVKVRVAVLFARSWSGFEALLQR